MSVESVTVTEHRCRTGFLREFCDVDALVAKGIERFEFIHCCDECGARTRWTYNLHPSGTYDGQGERLSGPSRRWRRRMEREVHIGGSKIDPTGTSSPARSDPESQAQQVGDGAGSVPDGSPSGREFGGPDV